MISPSLKSKVAVQIFSGILENNEFLKQVIMNKVHDMNKDQSVSKRLQSSKLFKKRVNDIIISLIAA